MFRDVAWIVVLVLLYMLFKGEPDLFDAIQAFLIQKFQMGI